MTHEQLESPCHARLPPRVGAKHIAEGALQLLVVLATVVWMVGPWFSFAAANSRDTPAKAPDYDHPVLLATESAPPWTTDGLQPPTHLVPVPSSPRDALINVSDDELQSLFDSSSLAPDNATLLKILFHLARFDPETAERMAGQTRNVPWHEVEQRPESHQLEMFHLKGHVMSIERVELDEETAELFEFEHYYRARWQLVDASSTVTVIARRVPQAWHRPGPLNAPSGGICLLLQGRARNDGVNSPQLLFATDRIAWHPDAEDPGAGIGKSQVLLGSLGMDVGLFDELRLRNAKGLDSAEDSECFFDLLAAVSRVRTEQLPSPGELFELSPLLLEPQKRHGALYTIEGNARRITKIVIDRPYHRRRLGSDHYYQIDVFVPLGNQRVRLSQGKGDALGPVFANDFPVTVCAVRLPGGLKPAESLNETIRLPAFFFKLWTYKSQYVRNFDTRQRQVGPMFVGLEPELIRYERQANPIATAIGISVVVIAMAGIWLGLWLYGRGDKKFEQQTLRRKFEIDGGTSLDELAKDVPDRPDFRGL